MAAIDLPGLPESADEVRLLWALLDDTTRMRRAEAGPIAPATLVWSPAPGMHSIGSVLMHIIDAEAYWIHEVLGGVARTPEERTLHQADATNQWNHQWANAPELDHAALLALHDTVRERSKRLAGAFDDPAATFPKAEGRFTLRWVLKHVATHEAYHYGQIEMLRQMHDRLAK